METNDAEDNLTQALEHRSSIRRDLFSDWNKDSLGEEEEGFNGGDESSSSQRGAAGRGGGRGLGLSGRGGAGSARARGAASAAAGGGLRPGRGQLGGAARGAPGDAGAGRGQLGGAARGALGDAGAGRGQLGGAARGAPGDAGAGRDHLGGAVRGTPGDAGAGRGQLGCAARGQLGGAAGRGLLGGQGRGGGQSYGGDEEGADGAADRLPLGKGRGRGKRSTQGSQGPVRSVRGRGRGRSQSYKPPRSSSIDIDLNSDSQPIEDQDDDLVEEAVHASMKEDYDKADWTYDHTRLFCEICIQEIDAGNRSNGIMTSRGYKNIAEKYKIATGLRHSKVQLKNKLDLLKGLYGFWLQLNHDTGLGWNAALGTVVASDEYWEKNTKGHPTWKQLKKGPPEHEDLLAEMFGGIVVDGSSACAPGEMVGGTEDEFTDGGFFDGDDSDTFVTPPTNSQVPNKSLPRNRATASTATSPMKPRNQMVKVMQGIHATLKENCKIANKVMLGEHLEEAIKEVQSMAVRCGAREGTSEHFMATQLFKKAENRACFKAFETDEGRLLWLKQHCANAGLY